MKLLASALVLLFFAASLPVFAQQKSIDKPGLWEVLKKGSLPAEDLVQLIEERGVDFQLTAEDEQQLRSMRVDNAVIAAVRKNYRPAGAPPPEELNLPDGPPLTQNQVLLLLEAEIPSRTVARLIEKRKAAFTMTPEVGRMLVAAGARPGLLGTITLNQQAAPPPPAPTPEPVAPRPAPPVPEPAVHSGGEPRTLRVLPDEQTKRLRHKSAVVYPPLARQSRTEGAVIVEVLIGVNGRVTQSRAVSGPVILRQAAVDSVRSWQWEPAIADGAPAAVATEVKVEFSLR